MHCNETCGFLQQVVVIRLAAPALVYLGTDQIQHMKQQPTKITMLILITDNVALVHRLAPIRSTLNRMWSRICNKICSYSTNKCNNTT